MKNKALESVVGNHLPMGEVESIWVVVAFDRFGNEGVPAMTVDDITLPMMVTKADNLGMLRTMAKRALKADTVEKVVIRQFGNPTDIEEFHP